MDATTQSMLDAVRSNLNSIPIGNAEGAAIIKTINATLKELAMHLDGLSAELPDPHESETIDAPDAIASVEGVRWEDHKPEQDAPCD